MGPAGDPPCLTSLSALQVMAVQKRTLEAKLSENEGQLSRIMGELRGLRDRITTLQGDNASLEARVEVEERERRSALARIRELEVGPSGWFLPHPLDPRRHEASCPLCHRRACRALSRSCGPSGPPTPSFAEPWRTRARTRGISLLTSTVGPAPYLPPPRPCPGLTPPALLKTNSGDRGLPCLLARAAAAGGHCPGLLGRPRQAQVLCRRARVGPKDGDLQEEEGHREACQGERAPAAPASSARKLHALARSASPPGGRAHRMDVSCRSGPGLPSPGPRDMPSRRPCGACSTSGARARPWSGGSGPRSSPGRRWTGSS